MGSRVGGGVGGGVGAFAVGTDVTEGSEVMLGCRDRDG